MYELEVEVPDVAFNNLSWKFGLIFLSAVAGVVLLAAAVSLINYSRNKGAALLERRRQQTQQGLALGETKVIIYSERSLELSGSYCWM